MLATPQNNLFLILRTNLEVIPPLKINLFLFSAELIKNRRGIQVNSGYDHKDGAITFSMDKNSTMCVKITVKNTGYVQQEYVINLY